MRAAVLTLRLKKRIHQVDLEFNEVHFFSGLQIVLDYIRNSERKFPKFVKHRHIEIRKSTETKQQNYKLGKFNIADMCTRASPSIDLYPLSTWLIGPAFLYEQTSPDHPLEQEVEVINALEKIDKLRY